MSRFTQSLVVTPLSDGKTWVLLEPFGYDVGREGSGDTIEVPPLFMTDFASVPRPLWSIFPKWGRYGNAAVIHDYCYWEQSRRRPDVDRIFLEAMTVLGVGRITRLVLYTAVRGFGWWAWRSDRRLKERGVSMVASHLPDKSIAIRLDLQSPRGGDPSPGGARDRRPAADRDGARGAPEAAVSDRGGSRVRLRAMEGRDAQAVAALSGQLGYPSTPEQIEHRLHGTSRDPESALRVAEDENGKVVGWTHVIGRHFLESDPFAEIVGLVVDAGARRLGVGRALAAAAESWARDRGYATIRVRSNTAREESRPFYLGIGYETMKTQYVYRKSLG